MSKKEVLLKRHLLVSCEHASNAFPSSLRKQLARNNINPDSHRAWDPGALPLARYVSTHYQAPLVQGRYSRLVVDLNRPTGHADLFSPITKQLHPEERRRLEATLHRPYYAAMTALVTRHKPVLHLSIHSFTPILRGKPRLTDLALLYDPSRQTERRLAAQWLTELHKREPRLRLRRNFPYLGTQASLTSFLRRQYPDQAYAGIEVEICNELPRHPLWRQIRQNILSSLQTALTRTQVD